MSRENGRGGWIRTNAWQDQNLLPYRLATPLYLLLSSAGHLIPLEQILQLAMQHRNVASFRYKPCKGLCQKGRDFISFSFAWEAPKHTTSSSGELCFGKFT